MKTSKILFAAILSIAIFSLSFITNSTLSARDYYQIKVYTIKDKVQENSVEKYLKEAYL